MNVFTSENAFQKLFTSLDTDWSGVVECEEFVKLGQEAAVSHTVVEFIPLEEVAAVEFDLVPHDMASQISSPFKVSTRALFESRSVTGAESKDRIELRLLTVEGGVNKGRVYVFDLPVDQGRIWVDKLNKQFQEAKKRAERRNFRALYGDSTFQMVRARTRMTYESLTFQISISLVIMFGFLLDMVEAQVLPAKGSPTALKFVRMDMVVTGIFVVELFINVFVNSNERFRPFYSRAANWLDLIIVLISVANIVATFLNVELPNAKLLRIIRISRVVRVFKAFKGLQNLMDACICAFLPVCNTFVLLLVIASVYAILGTNFYAERLPAYFGSFQVSLFTMFEILMGNLGIARLMEGPGKTVWGFQEEEEEAGGAEVGTARREGGMITAPFEVAVFFVSFTLIAVVMMLNVVVAVLCDEFMQQVTRRKEEEANFVLSQQVCMSLSLSLSLSFFLFISLSRSLPQGERDICVYRMCSRTIECVILQ